MDYLVQGQDFLFNLAGQTSHLDSMQDPYTDLEINCRAQLSILEACRKHNPGIKLVFASTRQIYGKPDYLPVDERHPLHPVDVNGINKMAGEWYHILYNNVYGIRACALRLTNTYGPRMRVKDARQTFLGIWIRQLIEGERDPGLRRRPQIRDFNYVDDVVDALLLAAVEPRPTGRSSTSAATRRSTCATWPRSGRDRTAAGAIRSCRSRRSARRSISAITTATIGRFRRRLGWRPQVALREGLRRTLASIERRKSITGDESIRS